MKIGILTFHFANNYGAVWQAYALKTYLEKNNHIVSFVNYIPVETLPENLVKATILKSKRLAEQILTICVGGKRERRRLQSFKSFRREELRIAGAIVQNEQELRAETKRLDCVIVGSDQIWNPDATTRFDENYFLKFCPAGQRTCSYAASFGRSGVVRSHKESLIELTSNIKYLSVRESNAVSELEELLGPDRVTQCVDPTMLLSASDYPIDSRYKSRNQCLFSYMLRTSTYSGNQIKRIAADSNMKLRTVQSAVRPWVNWATNDLPTPIEWLSAIANSDLVITNSYHGLLFSVIFRRKFIYAQLTGKKHGFSDRAISLLEAIGLEHRIADLDDSRKINQLINTEIDWETADHLKDSLAADSKAFLKNATGFV